MSLDAAAIAAWFVVVVVLTFLSPEGNAGAQLFGAVAFGAATSLTLWPLLWFATRHQAGGLVVSGRRSALVGLVVSILVIMRAIDVVNTIVMVAIIAAAVVVELAFTLRR
jgi:hypothetical protein